jgi:hypothetical protein
MFASTVPQNSAFSTETQVLHLYACRRLAKCSETLPNIILGLMEYNGCLATSMPRNNAFRFKWSRVVASLLWCTKVVHFVPKHKFRIFLRAIG